MRTKIHYLEEIANLANLLVSYKLSVTCNLQKLLTQILHSDDDLNSEMRVLFILELHVHPLDP